MKKVVLLCQMAALALACASCRNNNCYPVSGKVTYHGSPASGATVYFRRQGGDAMNDHAIMGIVQEDGSFELVSGLPGKGAPPGAYDVLIEWRRMRGRSRGRPQQVPDVLKGGYADPKRPQEDEEDEDDVLKGRYADPKRPLLHASVEAKATSLPPFELID